MDCRALNSHRRGHKTGGIKLSKVSTHDVLHLINRTRPISIRLLKIENFIMMSFACGRQVEEGCVPIPKVGPLKT